MKEPRVHAYAGGVAARYWLLGSAVFLMAFGLVMIYSASSVTALAKGDNSWIYLAKQLGFIVAGWIAAIAIGRYDYRRLREKSVAVLAASTVLLLFVFAFPASNGSHRWIPLGLFNLQPSELAKVACIVAVSALAIQWQRGRIDIRTFAIRAGILAGVPALLIMMQPDMGTTATLIVAVAIVLVLAGIPMRWTVGPAAVLIGLASVFIVSSPYRLARFTGFMDPWDEPAGKGYQIIQSLYAFGTGGLDGVGLGLSRQKFFYLPEAHTDFIFAIIGEETGLIGTLAVVVAFAIFVWAGIRIASGARDDFGHLIAGGVTGMLAFQAFVNMAAVTGMIPVTGKPLPFVSYGGSSMLVTMICLGLLLSISEYGTLAPRAVRVKPSHQEHASESSRDRRRDGGTHLPRTDRGRTARRRA